MTNAGFLWPIDAPEAEGLEVARTIGFTEGVDFVHEDGVFRFDTTDKAMLFNRSLVGRPNTGRAEPQAG